MKRHRSCPPIQTGSGTFAGFRFPPEVILLAVRWYLRFGLSYSDLEGACQVFCVSELWLVGQIRPASRSG